MKLIEITLTNTPAEAGNYNYKVEIQGNDQSTWTTVHTGKFFALAGQTKVLLDLDDILYDHRFVGKQVLAPDTNITANEWKMTTIPNRVNNTLNVITNCEEYWYNNVRVTSLDTTPAFTAVTKKFDFMQAFDLCGQPKNDLSVVANAAVIPIARADQPTPHIPNNPPSGFSWAQPVYVYSATSTNITVISKSDNTQIDSKGRKIPQMVKLYGTETANATSTYTIGVGINPNIRYYTVTKVDSCNKPYYLIWMTNEGGLQCQSFESASDFSIGYETHNRVDMHNSEWKVNSTATGNWKLKSKNLSDTDFKAYGDMFNSPYVVLLDMINSRLHYVQIKTTDYEEKKRTRIDRKPIYFSIEVESADHWMV